MKKRFYLAFFLFFPGVLSSAESSPQILFLPLRGDVSLHRSWGQDFESALSRELQRQKKGVGLEGKKKVFRVLSEIFTQEEGKAQEAYARFRYQEAEDILKGREDLAALKCLARIRFASGDEEGTRQTLRKIVLLAPQEALTTKEFSPRLVQFFEELKKEARRSETVAANDGLSITGETFREWEGRGRNWMETAEFDGIVAYEIKKVGWNEQVTVYFLTRKGGLRVTAVELMEPKNLSKAANILIKKLFLPDGNR